MKSLIDNRPGPRGPRSTVTCRLKGGVGSCHAKGETAGATVRTTADVAVARISKKDNRASPDHGNPWNRDLSGSGPRFVHSGLYASAGLSAQGGDWASVRWIVVWIRPSGGSSIPRSVTGSRGFEGRGGGGAELAWFVLLVRVIADLGGPMRTDREPPSTIS
ncbi:hypothetical protein GCM10027575_38340 [Phytohabitans suffuscus]